MRIGIRFGGAVAAGDAVLVQAGFAAPDGAVLAGRFTPEARGVGFGHGFGCACCVPRGAVAEALRLLFLDRARSTAVAAGRVVVIGDTNGEDSVRRAVAADVLLQARFFFEDDADGATPSDAE